MLRVNLRIALLAVLLAVLLSSFAWSAPLRVAMYVDDGVGSGWVNVAAALDDPARFEVTTVMGADIRAGILANFDVLIHPGGSGSAQGASLEESGRDSVRAFVRRGGGYLGICAGSYLASSYYSWSLNLLNAKVIDSAHWDRGTGPVDVRFSGFGREMFSLAQDTVVIEYRQGALMAPAQIDSLPAYVDAGAFASEIALNGAPTGVMIGSTAFAFSVYHQGRAVAFSPHPEVTPGYEYMVADAAEWVASSAPFLAVSAPRELETWKAGSIHAIQWINEGDSEPVAIEYSTDNGASWQPVASGVTARYNWTVPATVSTECLLRVTALADGALTHTVPFAIVPPPPSIQSARGGNWSDMGTWVGGVVPGANDNVVIGSGHTVIVDVASSCLDISFQDAAGRLGLTRDLNVYGNFNIYDTATNPFYSGSSLWGSTARMVFTGDADVQTITNLGVTSTSPYPCRFQQIVVDKSNGKLTTNPIAGLESNLKLGIGVSLEVVNGIFELGRSDDIEGRTVSGTATSPTITVQAGGIFRMLGSSSHVRRGNFVGDDTSKLGRMTVFGEAYVASSTTNRINLGGIDVESGGLLQVPYYSAGGNMGVSCFNPGAVTVKAGGTFVNSLNSAYWFTNVTTPNTLSLLDGGTIEANSSAPLYPPLTVNEGTFVYSRSSSDQVVFDMDYRNLELRNSTAGARKIWTLGADRTVSGELNNCYSAQAVIVADAAHTLTIGGNLRLTSGAVDHNDPDVALTMADGSAITVATGSITRAPAFAGMVDLDYISTAARVATGQEMPVAAGVLRNLSVSGDKGVDLATDITVEGVCTIAGSDLFTGAHFVNLTPTASLAEAPGATVIGTVVATRTVGQSVNEVFGGIGLEILAAGGAPGLTQVLRTTGATVDKGANDGITRFFQVDPANNAGLNATVVFHYDESELNGINEGSLMMYADNGSGWTPVLSVAAPPVNTVTSAGVDVFSRLVLGADGVVASLLRSSEIQWAGAAVNISWFLSEAIPAADFQVFRLDGETRTPVLLQDAVVATGDSSYRIVDAGGAPGTTCTYRVDVKRNDGTWTLFETDPVQIPRPVLSLGQNHPNPFNPQTAIDYSVPATGHVTLDVYDIAGHLVARLVDDVQSAGAHSEKWDGRDRAGNQVSSGTYFYRMTTENRSLVRKMLLVR